MLLSIGSGIFFAVGVRTLDNYRLEKTAKILVSDLREARERAITENQWQEIRFYPAANMYRIVRSGARLSDVSLEPGVELENAALSIAFYPTGSPSEGATILLRNKRGKQLKVVVAAVTGRVRLAP